MINPFKRFRSKSPKNEAMPQPEPEEVIVPEEPLPEEPVEEKPADSFVEWCRSMVQGGIVPNGRNDIFEAYSVFGTDGGRLICRYYHYYPEHEKDFGLSYSRELTFEEFNKRLLSELNKGDVKLDAYNECIEKARELCGLPDGDYPVNEGFSDEETAVLKRFCESTDTLIDPEFRTTNGVFYCGSRSVVGDFSLHLRFRRPLPYDALHTDVAGVGRKSVEFFDIENLWIMSVCNRLREQCKSCEITLLTSEWSLKKESVYLIKADAFPGIDGDLLVAVADEEAFPHFGFYSLDFSKK